MTWKIAIVVWAVLVGAGCFGALLMIVGAAFNTKLKRNPLFNLSGVLLWPGSKLASRNPAAMILISWLVWTAIGAALIYLALH